MKRVWRQWIVIMVVAGLLLLAYEGTADDYGHHYTQEALKRALVTFAIARGLNAVISVAQGTEVAIQPAGVGVNFTPGQILDPLNDLIEWFSWVMLMAATSLGIQELMLTILSAKSFTWLLLAVSLVVAVLALKRQEHSAARQWSLRLLTLLLVVRFAVPLMALTSEGLYAAFMEERYNASAQRVQSVTERIGEINRSTESGAQVPQDDSLLGSAKRLYQSTVATLDVSSYVERYQTAAADVSEQVINLIVVFVVQTVVLPLLFLWGVVQVARRVVQFDLRRC
ncbi:MAG TPA: hypothetical protein VGE50_07950 [Gammaproteobacteria bacterium]